MKRLLFILCCWLTVHTALAQDQPLTISEDLQIGYQTFNIDITSITRPFTSFSIKDVVKYHGLYFCLFKEEPFDNHFFTNYSHILVIRPEDFSFNEVDKPEDIVFSDYSQIIVRNDSVFIKSYYKDEKDYCIIENVCEERGDVNWTLKETSPLSSVVYEDNDYKIVFTDKGEWGQYMSFIGQSDDVEHIYSCSGQVFKKSDGFYFCNKTQICRITNPKEGIVHERGSSYLETKASHAEPLFFREFSGFLYRKDKDTLMNAFFMHDDTIRMFETDKDGTYLSKFDGQRVIRMSRLNQRYDYIGCSWWGNNSKGDGGLFYCLTSLNSRDNNFDLIDVNNDCVKIISVVTNHSPSISLTGNDGLRETLSFVTDVFSSKTIDDADVLERHLGSYRINIPHHLSYASQYESESRTYYRFVDNVTFVSAEYGYDPNTGLLNSLMLEWRPSSDILNNKRKRIPFPQRIIKKEIIATINQVLPCKSKNGGWGSLVWEMKGLILDLWQNGIRLLIEKKQ